MKDFLDAVNAIVEPRRTKKQRPELHFECNGHKTIRSTETNAMNKLTYKKIHSMQNSRVDTQKIERKISLNIHPHFI